MTSKPSLWPLLSLLFTTVMLLPLDRPVLFLPVGIRLVLGLGAALGFGVLLVRENPERRRKYVALAVPIGIMAVAPLDTGLGWRHVLELGAAFVAVLVVPPLILRDKTISFKLWPERFDRADILYTLSSIPLAWAGLTLYLEVLSPAVRFNWTLPSTPDGAELFKLFMGINAVGVWDELFFINVCFAILRTLFPYRVANPAQAVIYVSVLYDMAFAGWGPLFIALLALSQGAMFERSRILIWVLIVHLIVDYFLFQIIVEAYYPNLSVWWH